MQSIINDLVNIAAAEVGTKEEGGNNNGKRIRDYQKATWLKPDSWAWCAAFTAWCLRQALYETNQLTVDIDFKWRCRDASAFGWIKWAAANGLYVTDEKELAKKGDFVVFDFSHIGIVEKDQLEGDKYIYTIEGNTNGKGERDSVSGDGVWRKKRHVSLVRNYLRLTAAV